MIIWENSNPSKAIQNTAMSDLQNRIYKLLAELQQMTSDVPRYVHIQFVAM